MLHTNRQSVDHGPSEAAVPELIEFIHGILYQQFVIILSLATLVTGLGAVYVFITPPTFTARAMMIIDRSKAQVQLGGILNEVPVEVESQVQLIKSETMALAVVQRLNLVDDPEFIGPPLGLRAWVEKLRAGALPSSEPERVALSRTAERLKVNRTGYVVEIAFWSLNAERATQVVNAFAECYIEDQLKSKQQAAREAGAWLKERIHELRDQSLLADEAVARFKASNNIIAPDGRLINDQEVSQLNSQLVVTREKTAETRARLDRIEEVLRANSSEKQAIGTVTDTLNNPIIVRLRSQYLELVHRETRWSREYGPDHVGVVQLRRQIREIRSSIEDELRQIAETYKSEYEIAKYRQTEIEKAVAAAVSQSQGSSQALTRLRQLESSAETYRGLLKTALERNMELDQRQSFPGAEARLISRATTPAGKSSPRSLIILCASAIGGVLLGFGVGALRTSLDRVFRTPSQVEAALQARCLALAPVVKREKLAGPSQRPGPRTIIQDANAIWEVLDRPLSRFAEAMRTIKSASDLRGSEKSARAIGFTSSLPKEGKSTIAAAFALISAEAGARTILVDCDLRNPSLSSMLTPRAEAGLLEVISGKKPLEDVLWNVSTTNLVFLPTVLKSRTAESSKILASPSLRTFFDELRKSYDYLIVDFSPAAPIIDVHLTADLVDSYVFVIEWGCTKIDVIELALRKATVVQENLLGVVLNKVNFKTLSRFAGQQSDYYSDKYYAHYGQV